MRTAAALLALAGGCANKPKLQLRRVILYQNGIGYFERTGQLGGDRLVMKFSHHEVDDVLKTLTVIDRAGGGVTTVDVKTLGDQTRSDVEVGVRMTAASRRDVQVSYAVPTPTWKAAYRIVVDEDDRPGLLQAWAAIVNASQEDWNDVALTLATGAPMSYALDLHTPQYVERPDATGKLVPPQVWAPIEGEKVDAAAAAAAALDRDVDQDGVAAVDDLCPNDAEDKDGFEDEDGCPDDDNDKDRIVDRNDKCPNEPETYNGLDDTDGCPDRGRVVVTDTAIEILDSVYFLAKDDRIKPMSFPVLDAIAATLVGNPTIQKIEVQGHAAANEPDAFGLALRRAAGVRAYLVGKGVAADRLVVEAYGSTQPVDQRTTEQARARNRRVAFLITKRVDDTPPPPSTTERPTPAPITAQTLEQSARTSTAPVEVAGSVRYALGGPITVKQGTSTMVSILNKPVEAADVYLWRPDPDAPGSHRHPFRVVKLVNTSGFTLQPGSVAIFARGTFVGDALMQRLDLDEVAWLPYALDSGTTITHDDGSREQPVRIVSIHKGTIAVENTGIYTTTYRIQAGRQPARRIYLRHPKRGGTKARDLPPGTVDQGEAYLIPVPLQASKLAQLAVDEVEPRRRTLQLVDARATELAAYVSGSKLPDDLAKKLETALALRKDMATIEEELAAARERFSDVASRAHEIRESLTSVEKVRGAEDLRKKLVASLQQTTTESEALAKAITVRSEALATARGRLQEAIRDLRYEAPQPPVKEQP